MASIVWTSADRLQHADLPSEGVATIGRSAEATILIDHGTVSRIHARVTGASGVFRIENLSRTNSVTVAGKVAQAAVLLKDGDLIELGVVRLTFANLKAVAITGRLLCPHCRRVNQLTQRDCWFCGENLVNATMARLPTAAAACAFVDDRGEHGFAITGEQLSAPAVDGRAPWVIDAKPAAPVIHAAEGVAVTVNGAVLEAPAPVSHGDIVSAAGRQSLILLQ